MISKTEISAFHTYNTVIVGSGAAGFNAAVNLIRLGQQDIAMVTENLTGGTSRNTGSDKQTYYKLTMSGKTPDSVVEMAQTLADGECMDGDIALAEAALSGRCFFHLTEIGVPFPCNPYGEFIGYKTDHDPRERATSAGPLTSKIMTECLQKEAEDMGLKIYNHHQVIRILHARGILGLLCLVEGEYVIFNCRNIVYATGGPAMIYQRTVYPEVQFGASGLAFEIGAQGRNLTEWQYGISSIRPRWNVSGSFMQVLPRFISANTGCEDEKEFLLPYFKDKSEMLSMVFLKGYQWPFDIRKCSDGSSLIDLLVYEETVRKGRRVFLDFTQNPLDEPIDYTSLSSEAHNYMKRAGIEFGIPVERLCHINRPAYEFYLNQNIDLARQKLEIDVCAQHNNGGIAVNRWWQSNIDGFFVVGEAAGCHGVYRPGGSALNSTQVGSLRAAQYIAQYRAGQPCSQKEFCEAAWNDVQDRIMLGLEAMTGESTLDELWDASRQRMDTVAGIVRNRELMAEMLFCTEKTLSQFKSKVKIREKNELPKFYRFYDLVLTQFVYLHAMIDYIEHGGKSRGSALYYDKDGQLPCEGLSRDFCFKTDNQLLSRHTQELVCKDGGCMINWRKVRDIPQNNDAFETTWRTYMENRNVY